LPLRVQTPPLLAEMIFLFFFFWLSFGCRRPLPFLPPTAPKRTFFPFEVRRPPLFLVSRCRARLFFFFLALGGLSEKTKFLLFRSGSPSWGSLPLFFPFFPYTSFPLLAVELEEGPCIAPFSPLFFLLLAKAGGFFFRAFFPPMIPTPTLCCFPFPLSSFPNSSRGSFPPPLGRFQNRCFSSFFFPLVQRAPGIPKIFFSSDA